jgi:hypothetical protein
LEKKLRVTLDWTLDLVFSKDLVQFMPLRSTKIGKADVASIKDDFRPLPARSGVELH